GNLVANGGVLQPWSVGATVPINSQLIAMGKTFTVGATRVEVVIDNQLTAISEALSTAFIAKKDFVVSVDPDKSGVLPEPATVTFSSLVLCALAARRRTF